MQKCFLVTNKETAVASYLQHRSIMEVTHEYRSLGKVNLESLEIVDVDKFLYIYYPTDDADLSFRSDMNAFRSLIGSAFFNAESAMFILVDNSNPLMEDIIFAALRNSGLPRDRVEIIHHTGALMFADVGRYVAGAAAGQNSSSSYRAVYIREADSEEKDRYMNTQGDLDAILPVLTDMSGLYAQRAKVEATSAGRIVTDPMHLDRPIKEFTHIDIESGKTLPIFLVSGEEWAASDKAVEYLVEYDRLIGKRSLVVDLHSSWTVAWDLGIVTKLALPSIKVPVTPEYPISILEARFNQVAYVFEFFKNIKGLDQCIFYVDAEDYSTMQSLASQLSERVYSIFVAHFTERSVCKYLQTGNKSTAIYLNSSLLHDAFDLKQYKEDFKGTIVAAFPTEDIDYVEFYNFATGGSADE